MNECLFSYSPRRALEAGSQGGGEGRSRPPFVDRLVVVAERGLRTPLDPRGQGPRRQGEKPPVPGIRGQPTHSFCPSLLSSPLALEGQRALGGGKVSVRRGLGLLGSWAPLAG